MDSERTEALLREIRDAQREHLDLYRRAVARQEASIEHQREAIAYQRRAMRLGLVIVLPVLALVIGLLLWLLLSYL